jgi:phosphatidylserine decarboxylase
MAKTLQEWLASDVEKVRGRPMRWLSEQYFFRDPARPLYSDTSFFFAPADGIVLYAKQVSPEQEILDIKGKTYSLRTALRDSSFDKTCLVIGIFMTFYDVHINRVPYAGRLTYRELDPIDSYNYPMIDVEKDLLGALPAYAKHARYLLNNQRVVNTVFSMELQQHYYILQVADYDVDAITPFDLKQNQMFSQNQRFSQIRYGSQVDLIIPLSERFDFSLVIEDGYHVEAGIDPLVKITTK